MTKNQIIETLLTLVIYFVLKLLINRAIDKIILRNDSSKTRAKIVKKAINIISISVFATILFSIFGVDQSEIVLFLSSFLTIMGIALFAQWSIISNITSGVILFFNHTIKLDDTIKIIDKDYEVEGRISDIKLFFTILKTENNEVITIPNIVFLNKMVKKIN